MRVVIQSAGCDDQVIETDGEAIYIITCGTDDNPASPQEMRELNQALHTELAIEGVPKMVITAMPVRAAKIG